MTTYKVSELEGALLDAAVAKVQCVTGLSEKDGRMCHEIEWDPEARCWRDDLKVFKMWVDYAPSSRWDQGGPIIERWRVERLEFERLDDGGWSVTAIARTGEVAYAEGPTQLIAVMRAYAASVFGETVELP